MRLATRFALSISALVPLLVLVAGLLVLRLASHDLAADRDRQLAVRLRALTPLATTYARRARHDRLVTADLTADRLSAAALGADGPDGLYVEVPGGPPLVVGSVPQRPPEVRASGAAGAAGAQNYTEGRTTWRFVAADLGRRGTVGRMWLFEPQQRLDDRIALLRRRLLLATLIAVGAGAAAGFALGRVAVRPLTALRDQARAVDARPDRRVRLATASGVVEVDELAALVNELLDRRDAAVARTGAALDAARAFAATAAHELRTPLTSMGTNLGLLNHPDLTAAERAEITADLNAEHARVQGLITVLRQLARAELADPAAFAEVDLAEIAGAAADAAHRRHGLPVRLSLANGVIVPGWAEGLRMIVDNLLDNAAVHGAPPVALTVAGEPGAAVLAVADAGPGIPPELRQTVFDRFERRPGSPGSGLGLTLIRQLVALHGGTVGITAPAAGEGEGARAGERPGEGIEGTGGGTRVEVRLPLAERPPRPPETGPATLWFTPGPLAHDEPGTNPTDGLRRS